MQRPKSKRRGFVGCSVGGILQVALKRILIEVEHVEAHLTEQERRRTSLLEKCVTKGNEKADEPAKERAMMDEGFMS